MKRTVTASRLANPAQSNWREKTPIKLIPVGGVRRNQLAYPRRFKSNISGNAVCRSGRCLWTNAARFVIRGTASAPKISPSAAAFAQRKKQSGDEVSGSGPSLLFFLARHFAAVRSGLEQMERHYRSALRSIVGRLASGLENRRRHSFIELDFVAEEGELRSEGFFLAKRRRTSTGKTVRHSPIRARRKNLLSTGELSRNTLMSQASIACSIRSLETGMIDAARFLSVVEGSVLRSS